MNSIEVDRAYNYSTTLRAFSRYPPISPVVMHRILEAGIQTRGLLSLILAIFQHGTGMASCTIERDLQVKHLPIF